MTQKVRDVSRPSVLLTPDENKLVFNMVGPRCTSLATAVVQLFITEGPAHNSWIQLETGVLCFIKNNQKKAYFFGIYCLERKILIWEHEVYEQIQYKVSKPFFHTFEAQEYMTAFNFASEEEASIFEACFQSKTNKEKRKLERLKKSIERSESREVKTPKINQEKSDAEVEVRSYNGTRAPVQATPENTFGTIKHNKRKKLTKAEIGDPCNFQHIYGPSKIAGWNTNKDLDIEGLMAKIDVEFLAQAGVSETHLKDKKMRSFIASFINDHGGVDAVTKEINENDNQSNNTKENTPVWSTVMNYATGGRKKPKQRKNTDVGINVPRPLVPVIFDDWENKKKVEDSSARPTVLPPLPPPPPIRVAPARPQPPRQPPQSAGGPPPPPPPPPPPAPMFSPPTHQLPTTSAATGNTDNRADLFQSIRSGQTLKRVQTMPENPNKPQEEKGDLLNEIQKGVNLKKVPVTAVKKENKKFADGSLANALALALEERSKSMYSDNSSSEDASSECDEWDA